MLCTRFGNLTVFHQLREVVGVLRSQRHRGSSAGALAGACLYSLLRTNSFDASMNRVALSCLDFFSTIMQVAMVVPKKNRAAAG